MITTHIRDGLQSDIRQLPYDATATQKAALQEKRLKLAAQITKFHEIADQMIEGIELDWGTVHVDDPLFCMAEADEQAWEVSDEEIPAEDMEEELALRKGQANDFLEKI
ncbi:hypothetical protein BDR07DRAFT_1489522 [Suillus spraguei]|nr:hypothetical protein BDR07DRAFT_1489522 [Suillus spraguei]